MKRLLSTWFIAIFLNANTFAQDVPPTIEEVITALNGNWDWKYTVMSFFPDTVTVEEASPIELSFSNIGPLPPNSIYYMFTGVTVGVASGITEITATANGWSVQFEVNISGSFPWEIIVLNDNELLFLDGSMVVDGPYAHYFTRAVSSDCLQVNPVITGDLFVNCEYETSVLSTQTFDTYQWYRRGYFDSNAVPIPGATGQTYTVNIYDVLSYFSVAVTSDTCSVTSNEVLIDQLIGLPPYVVSEGDFTIDTNGNTIVCPGDTLWLTAYNIANLQWYINGESLGAINQNPLPVTYTGNYTVTGNDPICTLNPVSLGLEIGVIAPPKPQLEPLSLTEEIGILVNNAEDFVSFQWYYNGMPIINATNSSYLFDSLQFGNFYVATIDSYGCNAVSDIYSFTTGTDSPDLMNPVLFYPMPVSETLYFGNLSNEQIYTATLYELTGRILFQNQVNNNSGIKISHLPEGIYLCKISDSRGSLYIQKVVIAR